MRQLKMHLRIRRASGTQSRKRCGRKRPVTVSESFYRFLISFLRKPVQIPLGIELGDEERYGIGMFFFPQDEIKTSSGKENV